LARAQLEHVRAGRVRLRSRTHGRVCRRRRSARTPYNGRWIGITSAGTGVYVSLAGYVGVTVGWVEGFELNFFGALLGFDIRRPALKFPGLGRFGVAAGL
jgi:hypothetical protein